MHNGKVDWRLVRGNLGDANKAPRTLTQLKQYCGEKKLHVISLIGVSGIGKV